eukprot:Awhi_evm1s9180
MLKKWTSYENQSEFVSDFLLNGIDFGDLPILSEFRKQADLITPMATEVAEHLNSQ